MSCRGPGRHGPQTLSQWLYIQSRVRWDGAYCEARPCFDSALPISERSKNGAVLTWVAYLTVLWVVECVSDCPPRTPSSDRAE